MIEAWRNVPPGGRLAVVERDLVELMGGLGRARTALAQQERESRERGRRQWLELLEVVDAFERALERFAAGGSGDRQDGADPRDEAVDQEVRRVVSAFRSVYRLLMRHLEDHGVERIGTPATFDPRLHRAVEAVADADVAEGDVVREVEAGYAWQDAILRKPGVVVSCGGGPTPEEPEPVDGPEPTPEPDDVPEPVDGPEPTPEPDDVPEDLPDQD